MAIDIADLKKLSSELQNQQSEVYQRAAASAGYYYSYHYCLQLADTQNLPLAPYKDSSGNPIHGVHEKLIQRFTAYKDTNKDKERCASAIGIILSAMRTLRKEADYDLDKDFPASKTNDLTAHRDRLLQKCDEFLNF